MFFNFFDTFGGFFSLLKKKSIDLSFNLSLLSFLFDEFFFLWYFSDTADKDLTVFYFLLWMKY